MPEEKKPKPPVTRERVHRSVKLTGAAALIAAAGAVGAFFQPFIVPSKADTTAEKALEQVAAVANRVTVVETTVTVQNIDVQRRLSRMEGTLDAIWNTIRK